MKRSYGSFVLMGLWALTLMFVVSCDTADNVRDPDLDYFVKFFGGDGDQRGVDMLVLNDGSLILLGTYSYSTIESDIYLLRVGADGNVIWEEKFGDGLLIAKDIEPTNDGNFVLVADSKADETSDFDILLYKISPEGTILAESGPIGSALANDYSKSVTSLVDGSFIVSGTTELTSTWVNPNDPGDDLGNVLNYRFDQNLQPFTSDAWSPVTHGFGANLDVAVKTGPAPDGFYVYGYTNSDISNNNPNERLGLFYFKRGSTNGSLSEVYYPGNIINVNDTQIEFVQPVPAPLGGGVLVIGTSINNLGVSEIFLARLRSSLTFRTLQDDASVYMTIPLGRNIRGMSAAASVIGEKGFLIVGNEVRTTGAANFWLTKIDQSGSVLWSATFGSESEEDAAAAVVELPDGRIVVLGTMGLADNQYKMALIKLNPRGQLLK
jgi:hypothetical protein